MAQPNFPHQERPTPLEAEEQEETQEPPPPHPHTKEQPQLQQEAEETEEPEEPQLTPPDPTRPQEWPQPHQEAEETEEAQEVNPTSPYPTSPQEQSQLHQEAEETEEAKEPPNPSSAVTVKAWAALGVIIMTGIHNLDTGEAKKIKTKVARRKIKMTTKGMLFVIFLSMGAPAMATVPAGTWRAPRSTEGSASSARSGQTGRGGEQRDSKLARQRTDEDATGARHGKMDEDEDDKKGNGRRRRGRGGRRRTQAKERKLSVKDTGLKDLLMVIMRLLAKTSSQVRTMWGILTCTCIISSDATCVKKMQDESKMFASNVSNLRGKLNDAKKTDKDKNEEEVRMATEAVRGVGPPAPHVMAALV
jgi:hypothetical protein